MKALRFIAPICLAMGLLAVSVPAHAAGVGPKQDFAPDRILVKFQPGTSQATEQAINGKHRGLVIGEIPDIGVEIVRVPYGQALQEASEYRSEHSVLYAEPDDMAHATFYPNDTYFAQGFQWNLTKISAPQAWDITKGSPDVKVAVLDSGIDASHPDLQGKIVGSVNFSDSPTTNDIYGHGTHIAGIIGADTNNSLGIAGVAYNTSLLNVKVIDDVGYVYDSDIISGITWAADNGADVISMSFGQTSDNPALEDAVNYAWNKGLVLVGPAGNNGNSVPFYPAAYPNVIAVAATDYFDNLVPYSDYGSWVDVAAPGDSIWSTETGGGYGYLAGTSVASPEVAGLAALLFTTVKDTNGDGRINDEVRAAIENNCDNIGVSGIGHGRINAYKAVLASTAGTTGAISGTVTDSSNGAAISGATVTAGTYSTMTGSGGTYTINSVATGTYTVTASAAGYTNKSSSATVTGGGTATVNFSLAKTVTTGTISGTVTDSSSGAAISGATIAAGSYSAITNSLGSYTISNVATGTYTVTASASGYTGKSSSATVTSDATVTVNFSLAKTVTTGTVTGTLTNSSNGAAISGATVSSGAYSATTNSAGSYSISSVPAGGYTFTASKTGYTSKSTSVSVTAGATASLNFALTPNATTGTITGTITDSSTHTGISGATVTAGSYSTTTSSGGSYTLSNIPAGAYTVTASASGYNTGSAAVSVTAGQTTTANIALTALVTTGSISGTVTDSSTGGGIAGATVTAGSYSATTNGAGSYTINNVPAGTYTVTASASGFTTSSTSATVSAGSTTPENFSLTSTAPATMWVSGISISSNKNNVKVSVGITSDAGPVSGAQVIAILSCSDGSQWYLQGSTNRRGSVTFNISKPPAGTYTYTAQVTGVTATGYAWVTTPSATTSFVR